MSFDSFNVKRFRLPPEVSDLDGHPLYILIAYWGLRQNQVLTTSLISRVFHIEQVQAQNALHYIRHEGRLYVKSERVPLIDQSSGLHKGLRIVSIIQPEKMVIARQLPKKNINNSHRIHKETRRNCLRQWMISRRILERVPDEILEVDK